MAYVIYRTDTTEIVSEKDYPIQVNPKTQGHAKASLTRIKKKFAHGFANPKSYSTFKFEGLGIPVKTAKLVERLEANLLVKWSK